MKPLSICIVYLMVCTIISWHYVNSSIDDDDNNFMNYILVNRTQVEAIANISNGFSTDHPLTFPSSDSQYPLVQSDSKGLIITSKYKPELAHNIMMILWTEVCDPDNSLFLIHRRSVGYLDQLSNAYRTLFVQDNVDVTLSKFMTKYCRAHYIPTKLQELTLLEQEQQQRQQRSDEQLPSVNDIVWNTPEILLSSYTTLLKYYLRKMSIDMWKISFQHNVAMEFSVEQFATNRFIWHPQLSSIAFVLDMKCLSLRCRHQALSQQWRSVREDDLLTLSLVRLKTELQELKQMMTIHFVYGYFVKPSEVSLFDEDCQYLVSFLQDQVSVVCAMMEVTETTPDLSKPGSAASSQSNSYRHGHSYYGDIREVLGQYAYDHTHADYYYLVDLQNLFYQKIPSILTALNRLHYGTLFPGFGILLHTSPSTQNNKEEEKIKERFRDLNHYPFTPILTKRYFEIFTADHHLFHPSFPRSLNNYLLYDVFDVFDSVMVEETVLSKVYQREAMLMDSHSVQTSDGTIESIGGSDSISIVQTYLLSFQIYNEMLRQGRQRVLSYLNSAVLYGPFASLGLTENDLQLQRGDVFYGLFCLSVVDESNNPPPQCLSPSMNNEIRSVDIDSSSTLTAIVEVGRVNYPSKIYRAEEGYSQSTKGRVAVITAVFGSYEKSCKPFARQTVSTDFYCFTDSEEILRSSDTTTGSNSSNPRRKVRNGWIVDSTPYHLTDLQYEIDHNLTHETNAYHNNQHPFNIAKYYKTNFHHIPILQGYEVVIWIDGTVRVVNPNMSKHVLEVLTSKNETMMVFELPRNRSIENEAKASMTVLKYISNDWLGYRQPIQRVDLQYDIYTQQFGYRDSYWQEYLQQKAIETGSEEWLQRDHYGVWCTCFVAFNMKKKLETHSFLDQWHSQIRKFTTQDQVSFPFVIQQSGIHPYSLPQGDIHGNYDMNSFFVKLNHGL